MFEFYVLSSTVDHFSMAALTLVIPISLITLKRKSKSIWMLILFLFFYSLFSLRSFFHVTLMKKNLLVFSEVGMIFLYIALFFLVLFALFYYKEFSRRVSRIVISLYGLFLAAGCVIVVYLAVQKPSYIFQFNTDEFLLNNIRTILPQFNSILIITTVVIFLVKTVKFSESQGNIVKKIIFPKGRFSRASRNLALACLTFIIIGMLSIFGYTFPEFYPVLRRTIILSTIFTIFLIALIYLNNSTKPTKIMTKIVGISLLTILLIITNIVSSVVTWVRKDYDKKRLTEVKSIERLVGVAKDDGIKFSNLIKSNKAVSIPKHIRYIAIKPQTEGFFSNNYSLIYNNSNHLSENSLVKSDMIHKKKRLKVLMNKAKKNKIHDNTGKLINPAIDELRKLAIKKITEEKVPILKRSGRLMDDEDMSKSFIYYNFIKGGLIYEVGYDYIDFRKTIHAPAFNLLLGVIVLSFAIIIIFPLLFRIVLTKPMEELLDGVREVNDGNLSVEVPVKIHDEIGFLTASFNNMVYSIDEQQSKLRYYAENLEEMVKERTKELQSAMEEVEATNEALIIARDALWGEMELAKKIQTVLLPEKPEIQGYDISAKMIPAANVGGDYYDIISIGGINWFVIGDVSGHGVPAGLIMMMVQTSIHSTLEQNPNLDPSKLISLVNKTIRKNILRVKEDNYMTLTVLATTKHGEFTFSGLHQDIYIYRSASGSVDSIKTGGMWLGLADNIRNTDFEGNLKMNHGDTMILYTDGITEAWHKESVQGRRNPESDMFGEERLINILKKTGHMSSDEIKKEILQALDNYDIVDDVTLVVVKSLP
ncbi:SpoIIE family protein phosphatase [Spirochaetota bacterium]